MSGTASGCKGSSVLQGRLRVKILQNHAVVDGKTEERGAT